MKRIVSCVAILILAGGALATVAARRAGAQEVRPPLVIQDPCKVAAAAVTKAWSPSAPAAIVNGSPPYGTPNCTKYVADFDVPPLTPLNGHTTDYTISPAQQVTNELLHLAPAQCQTLVMDAIIYRQEARTGSLVRIGGGRKRGQVQSATCDLAPEASWVQPPAQTPPAQGTTRIRVAVSLKLGDQWLPVRITLHRPY